MPPVELRHPRGRLRVAADGRVLVDGDVAAGLVAAAAGRGAWTADAGRVRVVVDGPPPGPPGHVRAVDVDQTHRSWVVDERWQVKVGGLAGVLDHGVAQAVRARASGVVPALRARLVWERAGRSVVLATVTDHVAGAVDGWTWAVQDVLDGLATDLDPAWPGLLGAVAARLHRTLAGLPVPSGGDAAGLSVPFAGDAAGLPATFAGGSVADPGAESGALPDVPGPDSDPRPRARAALADALAATRGATHRRLAVRARALRAAIDGLPPAASVPFAIHGDLHVGQALRADGRLWVVDLDGDPQLGPRRDHAARDVAHLLVSVDTVARVVQRRLGMADPRALGWADRARATLLDGYRAELATSGAGGLLDARLLPGFAAEQVLRELLYAARYLPRWTYAGEGALLARYPATPGEPCGACDDPACGREPDEPWSPPPTG